MQAVRCGQPNARKAYSLLYHSTQGQHLRRLSIEMSAKLCNGACHSCTQAVILKVFGAHDGKTNRNTGVSSFHISIIACAGWSTDFRFWRDWAVQLHALSCPFSPLDVEYAASRLHLCKGSPHLFCSLSASP
jgi:hypothetical protein